MMGPPDWQGSASDYLGQSAPQQFAPPQQPQMHPPQQPMPQQPAPGTLGAVQQAATGGGDIMQQYQEAMQAAMQAYSPALRQPIQEEQHGLGWWLGNIATMGTVGVTQAANRQAYNTQVMRDNQRIKEKAANEALDIVKTKMSLGNMGFQQQLGMARLQAQYAGLALQGQRLAQAEADRQFRRENNLPIPTPEQADATQKMYGLDFVPGPTGKGHYAPSRPAYNAPDPRSPVGEALGGGTAGGTMTPEQVIQQKKDQKLAEIKAKEEQKTVLPTAATRTMAEKGPKVLALVKRVREDLSRVNTSNIGSRWREFKTGTLGIQDPAFMHYRTNAGLLQTALMQMHTGSRGSEMMLKKFQGMLDQGVQDPANMESALTAIEEYANDVAHPAGTDIPGASTPSSTPTTSTTIPGLNLPPGFKVIRRVQ